MNQWNNMTKKIEQMASNAIALPQSWPHWPYLGVIKHLEDNSEDGSMVDLFHFCNLPGYSSTVFLTKVYTIPNRIEDVLALPYEMYDTPEEVAAAGWQPSI